MKREEQAIREALDNRLSFFEAAPERRARIRQRLAQEEVPVVRRKLSTGLVLAIVTALVLTSVALAMGINMFKFFGEDDARYEQIAPQTELAIESPATVESDALGTTTAAINSAYYDGKSLIVGYVMENSSRTEPFTPTQEQLSRMEKSGPLAFDTYGEENLKILTQFYEAANKGEPCGVVEYAVYPSDHTETDDGIDLPPSSQRDESPSDGMRYSLREYVTPLPAGAQDRDSLKIRIRLNQYTTYHYFDGKEFYYGSERKEVGAMTATARRADAQNLDFTGHGEYNGAEVTVNANVSSVQSTLMITAVADAFAPLLDADNWYDAILLDDKGNQLRTSGIDIVDARTIKVMCEGNGTLPETLKVYITVNFEGEVNELDLSKLVPIVLAKQALGNG